MIATAGSSCDDLSSDPSEIANGLAARLEAININKSRLWEFSGDVAERVYRSHQELATDPDRDRLGIPTGYMTLDEMTGGYFPGQLWMIAARSYMGKSAVALSMGQKLAARGNSVYFASYEMSNDELMERMYADRAVIPLSSFTKGRLQSTDLQKVLCESQEIAAMNLLMDDSPPDSVSGIRARVKLASSSRKVDLLIVDHLLLVPYRDRRVPRHQQLIEITRDLKRLAKDCECTVLLLSQLNADADGKEPNDTHYSESKAILQNLDVSILLHREDKKSEEMLFKVTKNRKGAPGQFSMKFLGEYQRVEDYPLEETWTGM
jgi:replicative DNA helicase